MTVAQLWADRRSEVAFSGGRAGSGPATWGQQAIWDVVRNLGTDAARYNVSGGLPLPSPVPAGRVEAAVRDLVLLHESLRTRLRTTGDGRVEQVVHAAGGIPLVTRAAGPDTVTPTAYALRDELLAVPFDAEREWPLRVGVVQAGGDAHYVVFFLSHTASDGWGLRNLLADFAALLRGPLPARDLLQPLEEAAFQTSERGRRRDAAARRSWRRSWAAARRACSRRGRAGRRRPRSPTRCSTPPRWAWPWTGSRARWRSAPPRSSSPRRPRRRPASPASARPSSRSW
ncbi:condensation domain-containing protein [Dactylosporangium sp. NBC_01737]|uniref:condensation domain-containing protein n=1 Tax=Dactylosporangium sp. NBC_01737 TaxID=2975959 RepID=UPI002E0FB4BA|nr:condensation domain-containing protein [Dactylosporangium sp. NBC_01737]